MFVKDFHDDSFYCAANSLCYIYADYDKYVSAAKAEGKNPVSLFNFILGRY